MACIHRGFADDERGVKTLRSVSLSFSAVWTSACCVVFGREETIDRGWCLDPRRGKPAVAVEMFLARRQGRGVVIC